LDPLQVFFSFSSSDFFLHSFLRIAQTHSTHFSQLSGEDVKNDDRLYQKVDYSTLPRPLRNLKDESDLRRLRDEYTSKISELTTELSLMTPNLKAGEKLEGMESRLRDVEGEVENVRGKVKVVNENFENVRRERRERFVTCVETISEHLRSIYQSLTTSKKHPLGGSAYLSWDELEEPFLGGVKFNVMPPSKRFRDMDQLSGGEKTIAALALLFACHAYKPSPFLILDEVDAALDKWNVETITAFLRSQALAKYNLEEDDESVGGKRSGSKKKSTKKRKRPSILGGGGEEGEYDHLSSNPVQIIVISLKPTLFSQAQGLVGICKDKATQSSQTLTLQLDLNEESFV